MSKTLAALSVAALAIAGATFVVLYPIIGVALWIAFVAAGGALAAFGLATAVALVGTRRSTGEPAVRMNPIVDVTALRVRYFVTLGFGLIGGFMVVESFAFSAATASAISFALGIAVCVGAAGFYAARMRSPKQILSAFGDRIHVAVWDVLAVSVAVLAAWNIVQSLVFGASTVRWLTFANGLGLLGVSLVGMVVHELSTERVVHALEVVGSESKRPQSAGVDREPARTG